MLSCDLIDWGCIVYLSLANNSNPNPCKKSNNHVMFTYEFKFPLKISVAIKCTGTVLAPIAASTVPVHYGDLSALMVQA